ncbi:MAG: penicillin-binding protein [Rhizobiales bacterium 62-17]|nr:MAG: penicillin-binding protein [Rhizobiales bacterium 62-17]
MSHPHSFPEDNMQDVASPARRRSIGAWLMPFLRGVLGTRIGKSGSRVRLITLAFGAVFVFLGAKLVWLGMKPEQNGLKRAATEASSRARPDIVDRNGDILATDIKIDSVFAEPRRIIDKDEAVELLTAVLPDVNARELRERLGSRKGFIWVKRGITPKEREEVFRLGLPGVGFLPEHKRVYPNGPVAAHVLGFTNTDNIGIAGVEKYIDGTGLNDLALAGFTARSTDLKPIKLSLDIKATYAVRDELVRGMEKFKAKAAAAAIMDVNTGEVIAIASLPDYDPNNPVDALEPNRINRMTVGVFEMGSTFKALTMAMAIDARKVTVNSKIDARGALRYGRFAINDFHAQNRVLSVSEVFTYSSNVGTARMALMIGVEGHKAFLRKIGQLDRMRTELPESAEPIVPRNWGDLNTMTIAFGHGLAVAPLQAMMAVSALVNGGQLIKPTFLTRTEQEARATAPQVIRPDTSESMRYLMRLNAEVGSAKTINVQGYFPGGKTGTANKVVNGRYANDRVFTTFTAVAPADKPRYLFLTVYDEPQGVPETGGARTAAYNAGATTGRIIERVTPMLGLPPRVASPTMTQVFPSVARLGVGLPSSGSAWR